MSQTNIPEGPDEEICEVFFGVPSEVSFEQLVKAATDLHFILDGPPEEMVMLLHKANAGEARHWFVLWGPPRMYLLEPSIQLSLECPSGARLPERDDVQTMGNMIEMGLPPGWDHT